MLASGVVELGQRNGRTFEQGFDLSELGGIFELAEVFGLLSDFFAFDQGVFLVVDYFRSGAVELGDEVGEIDACVGP
jgi:hypothetical protein